MKSRKLFPNQTIECPNFCDPSCPFNCYSYPDYYYLSPPPPPPPLSDQNHYLSPYVIIFVSLLAGLFLLAGYYVIIVNAFFGFCTRNNWRGRARSDAAVSDEEFLDENRADHPIWFIASVGLQQSVINSITVCKYRNSEGLIEGTECSVCLNEFQEEETLRLLPKCSHAFHVSCIDTWLRAHVNCPLCRAHIVFDDAPTTAPEDRDSARIDPVVDNRIEISEIGDGENRGASGLTTEELVAGDCIDGRRQQVVSEDMQKIKRCVSMDSSSVERLGNLSIRRKQDGSSMADQLLHISPVPMKRSLSCGGRFFTSKRCRNMNSVLPL